MRLRLWLVAVTAVAVVAIVGGVAAAALRPSRVERQAREALERYDQAWAAAGSGQRFVPVGGLVVQIGDWEAEVGDNNKSALNAGLVDLAGALPDETPAPGDLHWADGTVARLPLVPATKALERLRESHGSACAGCTPLRVTGARLTTAAVDTDRGKATAPVWEFTLAGTKVRVAVVAVDPAAAVEVTPPPWDPYNAPGGLWIEGATLAADGRTLTVSFTGAEEGDGPCAASYTARAIESEHAAAIIVDEHRNRPGAACTGEGYQRTATVVLSHPLGDRAVLEVVQGQPVPVSRG
jgi:hypothetical protein